MQTSTHLSKRSTRLISTKHRPKASHDVRNVIPSNEHKQDIVFSSVSLITREVSNNSLAVPNLNPQQAETNRPTTPHGRIAPVHTRSPNSKTPMSDPRMSHHSPHPIQGWANQRISYCTTNTCLRKEYRDRRSPGGSRRR